MMYKLFISLCTLLFIASCSSSDSGEEHDVIEPGREIMINIRARVDVPEKVEARWGIVDSEGNPPAVYNANEVYFVVDNGLGSYNFLKLDMISDGTNIIASMQIKLTINPTTNRLDISNSQGEALSLDLGGSEKRNFFFSSKGVESVSMAINMGGTTVGGQTVYKPYGDTLYRTKTKEIWSISPGALLIDGQLIRGDDASTLDISCEMLRRTSVFSAKLIIVDDNKLYQSGGDYFDSAMGSNYGEWQARAYISDFPLYYSLTDDATISNSAIGIVDLCDAWANLTTDVSATLSVTGTTTTYQGCGILDASNPYIYYGNLEGKKLCFSIKHSNITKTLKIDLATALEANENLTGTAILFLSNLKEAFTLDNGRKAGEVLDIPYYFFVE